MQRFVLALLSALTAFGCATPDVHLQNRQDIEQASRLLDQGKREDAAPILESVILRTNEKPSTFEKQRFFAAYLLSRANTEAALEAQESRGNERFDWVSYMLKAGYYRGFAKQWQDAAAKAGPKSPSGTVLLPADLAQRDIGQSAAYMDLAWLVTYARTKFQRKADRDLLTREGGLALLTDYERAQTFCDELGIPDQMKAWVNFGLFDILRLTRGTQKEAYKFGITARQPNLIEHLPEGTADFIADWIEFEAAFRWESSRRTAFNRSATVIDREPVLELKARPLSPAEMEERRAR